MNPTWESEDGTVQLYLGDCLEVLPTLTAGSVDAVVTDPPYPEISREYGRMTEAEWWDMMMGVCAEVRRLLKPTGSAVFILQPNSKHVGQMRGWLWEFMAWVCREWNMVQDVWWWNVTALPNGVCSPRSRGLLRSSVKPCVWAGESGCYHNQELVLWKESEENARMRTRRFGRENQPSGNGVNRQQVGNTALERGGVTPFNLLPISNGGNPNWSNNGSAYGHSAGTPLELAKWWTRYICPPGGTVLDPFVGSGTMMLAAMEYGCHGIGIDKTPKYIDIARARCAAAEEQAQPRLEGLPQ